MIEREAVLLKNGLLLAAILVDVKNAELLTDAQKEKGRDALMNLVCRMKGLDGIEEEVVDEVQAVSEEDEEEEDSDSDPEIRAARKRQRPDPFEQQQEQAEIDLETFR